MYDPRTLNSIRLSRTLERVAPYFGLNTPRDVAATLSLQQIVGINGVVPDDRLQPPLETVRITDTLLNSSEGLFSTLPLRGQPADSSVLNRLNQFLEGSDAATKERFKRFITIIHNGSAGSYPNLGEASRGTMNSFGNGLTDSTRNKLSCYSIKSSFISPTTKNADLVSFFLNGFPTVELARAVPHIDIRFLSGREATDSQGRLNATSIYKFLEGAVSIANNRVSDLLVSANTVSGSINGAANTSGMLSVSGMELFTLPQTLVNAGINDNPAARAVPVLDPFRPFLSFKGLTVAVAPSVGLMSFKTATIEFVLHDRSRLHELADFLKPDLYGTTELYIEYGWSHPDGPEKQNPYADVLNYSRSREKYGIRNVSFSFDEAGQANIKLDVAMKGGNDFSSETIGSLDESSSNTVRRIRELGEAIARYREVVFSNRSGAGSTSRSATRDVAGSQILDIAGDYQNHIRLSREESTALTTFINALGRVSGGNNSSSVTTTATAARQLASRLSELYSNRTTPGRATTSATSQLTTTIEDSIRRKLVQLFSANGSDDMLPPTSFQVPGRVNTVVNQSVRQTRGTFTAGRSPATILTGPQLQGSQQFVSLAKLLLYFIGEPLVRTGKFDEVQFVFYPFNIHAGFANKLTTGQFVVDTNYFLEQYVRLRTESLQRAANINLNEFMSFIASTIVDDPLATVYGIDALYTRSRDQTTGAERVVPTGDSVGFQTRLENRLRNVTPGGDFKMPQIVCHLETMPLRRSSDGLSSEPNFDKTVLRIHVYDKQHTVYAGQGALLQASRNDVLGSVASLPTTADRTSEEASELIRSHQETVNHVIRRAVDLGLIERPRTHEGPNEPPYIIKGSAQAIKEFVMKTMPYIIYGAQGTTIKAATLQSQQNAELSTVNMLRSFRAGPLQANGEQPGGLPLRIIPCELGVTCLGCSLFDFAQLFFIDFQTGTTADNIYGVNGITHKLEPGSFETEVRFVYGDAYGTYESFLERINAAASVLNHLSTNSTDTQPAPAPRTT